MQMTELFERFLEFERHESMMDRRINGVPYWHLVRVAIFRHILDDAFVLKPAHPDFLRAQQFKSRVGRILGKFLTSCRLIFDVCFRNPLLAVRRRPILFSMTPRQAMLDNGRKVSLLLDFFVPLMHTRHGLFEYVLTKPTKQPFFRKVFRLSYMTGRLNRCRSGRWFADVTEQSRIHSEEVAAKLSAEFGKSIDPCFIAAQIGGALLFREVYRPVFMRAISRMRTKVVVTAVQYNLFNFTLTEAAHDLGVRVVELQHGTIYKSHAAYNLPASGSVYSPDYFLTWGDFWNRQMRNYPEKCSVSVGYPYLEQMFSKYESLQRKDGRCTILFISQANIADRLVDAACQLRCILPESNFRIIYKLHPNESLSWRMLYPKLTDSAVDVVSNEEKNIYACFSEADVVVGSCSTSLVEGAAWGLKTLVLRWLPGSDTMQDFVESGLMSYIESDSELCNVVRDCRKRPTGRFDAQRSLFVMPGSANGTAEFLDDLVDGLIPQNGLNMIK